MNPAPLPFVVDEEPDLEGLRRAVATVEDGAVCAFLGTARRHAEGREVVALRYEAYREMAETVGRSILEEAEGRFAGARVVAQHRIGVWAYGLAAACALVSALLLSRLPEVPRAADGPGRGSLLAVRGHIESPLPDLAPQAPACLGRSAPVRLNGIGRRCPHTAPAQVRVRMVSVRLS